MLNFQGAVYIKNGFCLKIIPLGGSILNVNPGSVLIINQQKAHDIIDEKKRMLELIKRKFTFIIETEKHELVGDLE